MARSRDPAATSGRTTYRWALAVIAALAVAAVARLCFFAVDSGEDAIVTEFGRPTQVITEPGLGPWTHLASYAQVMVTPPSGLAPPPGERHMP